MIELGAALLGAIIGGGMTIAGGWWQAEQQRRARVRSLQVALAAEISTIVTLARSNGYAEDLLQAVQQIRSPDYRGEFTALNVNTGHNYFSVYEGNAGQIGELPNDLSPQVVAFYQAARSWLDSMSKANAPGENMLTREEAAKRLDLLASQVMRIANFGEVLVERMSDPQTRQRILADAKSLEPQL